MIRKRTLFIRLGASFALASALCALPTAGFAPTADARPTATSAQSGLISKNAATRVALKHAGFKTAQVANLRATLGQRSGSKAYVVKFDHKNRRFSYAVNAQNKRIISYGSQRIKAKTSYSTQRLN